MRTMIGRTLTISSVLLGSRPLFAPQPLRAENVPFLRGDSNGDGAVTVADACKVLGYLFIGSAPPDCLESADTDDDGAVDISDPIKVLVHQCLGAATPCPPFPEVGPDPNDEAYPCDRYGAGEPVVDPQGKIEILGGVAGSDGNVVLTVAVSNSLELYGFSGTIAAAGGIFAEGQTVEVEPAPVGAEFKGAAVIEGRLSFGFVNSLIRPDWITPGSDVPLFEMKVCLAKGTQAGEYPLTLEAAELVEAATGEAIAPAVEAGTISVPADLGPDAGCDPIPIEAVAMDCGSGNLPPPDPPDPPDPPPGPSLDFLRGDMNADGRVSISDALALRRWLFNGDRGPECQDAADSNDDAALDITDVVFILSVTLLGSEDTLSSPFPDVGPDPTEDSLSCLKYDVVEPERTDDLVILGTAEAVPGGNVEIPILMTTARETEAIQLVFRVEPDLVELSDVEILRADDFSFQSVIRLDGEGVYALGAIPSLVYEGYEIPAGTEQLTLKILGKLSSTAAPGTVVTLTPVYGPLGDGVGPYRLRNELTYRGTAKYVSVVPEVFDGELRVVGDLAIFIRGDSNADAAIEMADAVMTLGFLFLGTEQILCLDAADANDDGELDITDPVYTLQALYLGGAPIPPPQGAPGSDPTWDQLGCAVSLSG